MIIQDSTTDALLRFLNDKGGSAGLVSDEGGMIFQEPNILQLGATELNLVRRPCLYRTG